MPKALTLFLILVVVGLLAILAEEARRVSELDHELKIARTMAVLKSTEASKEQAQVEKLTERNEAYKTESELLRQKLAGGGAAGQSAAAAVPAAVKAGAGEQPATGEEKAGAGMAKALGKMFSDPNMKKMMRQQQAMAVRMMYGDLTKQTESQSGAE